MHARQRRFQRPTKGFLVAAALTLGAGVAPTVHLSSVAAASYEATRPAAPTGCQLDPVHGNIKHVVFLEFDNVHFKRDPDRNGNTNVPSDLEQIPNLLNFIKGNGTLLTNHHTPLISHTSDDIASSESGLYPSHTGVATSANSYNYYDNTGTPNRTSGFSYWTSKIGDGQYNFTSAPNTNAPAPWVPYTRAGCNVGAVAMSGLVLENKGDIGQAFGTGSPQYNDPNYFANQIGVAVHCGQGNTLCSPANGGAADVLPSERGGYSGYNALYGSKPVAQAINSGAPLKDINGNTIVDDYNNTLTPGFPGFSISPQYSLGYVADMLEHNIPVTYAYIINAHEPLGDNPYGYGHPEDSNQYGPGEAHYVDQLKQFNDAFGTFFTRLKNDGIDKSNTLFVVTTDEEDHHVSENPSPANCDGVTIPCTYPVHAPTATNPFTTSTGELSVNFKGLIQAEQGISTPATVNQDDAPDLYLNGQPAPSSAVTRNYERATAALTLTNPLSYTLGVPANEPLMQYLAGPTELNILHMLTADPLRTPTFVGFQQPDYYSLNSSACGASKAPSVSCVAQNPADNWNHGSVQPQITKIWLGLVGPGVSNSGQDNSTFSDHPDINATIVALTGLRDDFTPDGRALVDEFTADYLPASLRGNPTYLGNFTRLGQVYKALNAPVGPFALNTLSSETLALKSGSSSDDSAYTASENRLSYLGSERDHLVGRMTSILEGVALKGQTYDQGIDSEVQDLIDQGQTLLAQSAPVQDASGGGAPTPELGSGELLATGLGLIVVALLYRRRQRRARNKRAA